MPGLRWKAVFREGSVRVGCPPCGTVQGECSQSACDPKVSFVFESLFSAGLHREV